MSHSFLRWPETMIFGMIKWESILKNYGSWKSQTNEKKGRDLFFDYDIFISLLMLGKRGYLFQKNGNSDVDITMFAI